MTSISRVTQSLGRGRPILLRPSAEDDEPFHLVLAASEATAENVHFLSRHGPGILSVALTTERLVQLQIPWIHGQTPASVALLGAHRTGHAAEHRAETLRALADPAVRSEDLESPGHVFPLQARTDGRLETWGVPEAALSLVRRSGLPSAAVLTPLTTEDGSVADAEQARRFAESHGLESVAFDAARSTTHAAASASLRSSRARLPTRWADFQAHVFEDPHTGRHDVALVLGEIHGTRPTLTRLHSECLTGDVLGSLRCDCGPQLHTALHRISHHGRGILLYLRQEGRGIGLYNKLEAYALQDRGYDTVEANEHLGFPADARSYRAAARILEELGVRRVELLTNNPRKVQGLRRHGIEVVKRRALQVSSTEQNAFYLQTKREKLGHLLEDELLDPVASVAALASEALHEKDSV